MQDDRIFFPKLEFNIKRLPVRSYSYKFVENGTIFESTEKCFHVLLADESLESGPFRFAFSPRAKNIL